MDEKDEVQGGDRPGKDGDVSRTRPRMIKLGYRKDKEDEREKGLEIKGIWKEG
jgi:hypothetical protein